jgi:hypothetical protein
MQSAALAARPPRTGKKETKEGEGTAEAAKKPGNKDAGEE